MPSLAPPRRVLVPGAARPGFPGAEALFDDLAAVDDPALAQHTAKGSISAGELALIIFMIIFFPIGIILLIVFIAD